jgi:hypothetical protein
MPTVELNINSNISEITQGIDQAVKSTDKLEKETKDFQQASQSAYGGAASDVGKVNREMQNMQPATAKLRSAFIGLGAVMAGAFSVAAIVAWGKAIVESTGAGGDAMERFREGVSRAMDKLNTAIATANFSNLISGLREAWEEGKRYADVLDEIQARQVALGAFKATLETLQAEQKLIARNSLNSVEVREAAIEEIVRLEKQKLSETLDLQDTELDEALRAAALRTGISRDDEEQLRKRKSLVEEYARAYGTITGVTKLNEELELANNLQSYLNTLITETISTSGDMVTRVKDYDDYNKAVAKLTEEEKRLLALRNINTIVLDEERDNINKLIAARAGSVTQSIEQETALERLRGALRNELLGQEKEVTKTKSEESKLRNEITEGEIKKNLELLDSIVKANMDARKVIQDLEGLDDLKINLDIDTSKSSKVIKADYDELQEVVKRSTQGQRDEINKNIEQLESWKKQGRITVDAYEQELERLQNSLAEFNTFAEDHPLAAALGIENEEQLNQIKDFVGQLTGYLNELVQAQVEATSRIVDDQNQRIDEQQQTVNREFELKKEGLANNFAVEDENLKKMQKARDEAIKEREKAVKLQRTLSTAEAGISLVTASANIIKGFSGIPVVGVVLGLAAVAAMIAGFVAASAKAKDATKMEHGGQAKHGLLKGARHSGGGIPINAEGGEWFINRQSSAKYSPLLDAINKDDQNKMKLFFDRKYSSKVNNVLGFDIDKSKKLGEIVKELKRGGVETVYGQGYIIEKGKGYTRKINLN